MQELATKPQDKFVTESQWVVALKGLGLLPASCKKYEYNYTLIDLEDYMEAHKRARLSYGCSEPQKVIK